MIVEKGIHYSSTQQQDTCFNNNDGQQVEEEGGGPRSGTGSGDATSLHTSTDSGGGYVGVFEKSMNAGGVVMRSFRFPHIVGFSRARDGRREYYWQVK